MFTKNDFFCMLARKSTSSKNDENNFISGIILEKNLKDFNISSGFYF